MNASRYRIDRVRELLRQDRKFSVDDFKRFQHDDYSKLAEALVPHLVGAATALGASDRPGVRTLAAWNFRMARELEAPLLFSAWSVAAYRRVAATRDVGPAAATLAARPNYTWLEQLLVHTDATLGANAARTRDSLLLLALDDAEAELTRRYGPEWASKAWGDVHVATFQHPLSPRYDLAPVSRGGDGNTVYATGGRDYRQTSGASYRQIIDFADFDNSVATNVPGQSANPLSSHYGDLLPIWGRDEYIPLLFSRKRVEAATREVVWLRP